MMGFAHDTEAIKLSLENNIIAHVGVLVVRQFRTAVLRYYRFNLVQQKWVITLLLLP